MCGKVYSHNLPRHLSSLLRKSYFPKKDAVTYKRLLATISNQTGSSDPQELPEFNEFQELHCQLKAAQQKARDDLQSCRPCGHLVLPIDAEEWFFQHVHRDQTNRIIDGIYTPLKSFRFTLGKCHAAKLIHLRTFGSETCLKRFSLTQKTVPRLLNSNSINEEENVSSFLIAF